MSGSDRTTSQHAQNRNQRDELAVIANTFDVQYDKYSKLLPSNVPADAFRNAFLTAVQRRPTLLQADRNSLWLSLQQCAGDGLLPDGREAALVIFNEDEEGEGGQPVARGNRPRQVVYMPMIRGLRKLCRNTGVIASIDATLVYRGEVIRIWREDGEKHFEHTVNTDPDADDSPQNIIGAYAVVSYKDGTWEGEWMSRAKLERVRAVSKAKSGKAPWQTWYDEMCRKTVLRRLLKQLDTSPELRSLDKALTNDPTLGPEIDGEAEEIAQEISAPPPPPRQPEAEPRRQEQARTEPKPAPREKHADPRPEAPPPAQPSGQPAPSPEESGSRPAPSGDAAPPAASTEPAASDQDGFQGWLVDADGVETTVEPYTDPVALARALTDMCQPDTVAILLELNEGVTQDAAEASAEANALLRRLHAAAEGSQEPAQRQPVAVPKTRSGAAHWPNYAEECQKELAACMTSAEIDAWIQLNRPSYVERAIEAGILKHIRARRAEIGEPAQNDAPASQEPSPEPAKVDKDEKTASNFITALAQYKTVGEIGTYSNSMVVMTTLDRWTKDGRPELVQRVKLAFEERIAELRKDAGNG